MTMPQEKITSPATHIDYQLGLPERFRASAVALYDEAFGKKFAVAVRSKRDRERLLDKSIIPEYAIVALADNKLIGLAGVHTPDGSFTSGISYRGLIELLGWVKGNWAALIFSVYERKPAPGELVMDGIAVHVDARGKGVGGRLLEEVAAYAAAHDFDRVRLDVIDINPKAKKLYERKGFRVTKTEQFEWLRWLLKFGGSTTMALRIDAKQ